MDSRSLSLVWSPEAVEAIEAVVSKKLRAEIVRRVELAAIGPGLHKPRPTASWGTVYLIHVKPFTVVYRFKDTACEVLDIVDATFMASYEIKE